MISAPAITSDVRTGTSSASSVRQPLNCSRREVALPLTYLLCMALVGLQFYPALLGVVACMLYAWRHDRYNLMMMLLLFAGSYGLTQGKLFGIRYSDMAGAAALVCLVVLRKRPLIARALIVYVAYAAVLFTVALFSRERMQIQVLQMREYLYFIIFLVPVAVFAGREFDIRAFFRVSMIYILIICAFYIIDAFVLYGNILMPATDAWRGYMSSFTEFYWAPLSFNIDRKYPIGLYLMSLMVYPVARYYTLNKWQWVLVLGALAASRTITVIVGLVLFYAIFSGTVRQLLKYAFFAIVGFVALYFIDYNLPRTSNDVYESPMRIASTVQQFIDLFDVVDPDDMAEFGSGRMAQLLPKLEVIQHEHREWTGLGFLHPEKTKIEAYIIDNELYSDIEKAEEVAIGVECVPAWVFLNAGIIGLVAHYLFFFGLWWIVRKEEYGSYFLAVMLTCMFWSLTGNANVINMNGLGPISWAFAAVYLQAKTQKMKDEEMLSPAVDSQGL